MELEGRYKRHLEQIKKQPMSSFLDGNRPCQSRRVWSVVKRWQHNGTECLIMRCSYSGSDPTIFDYHCGYVGIPDATLLDSKDYYQVIVHGGMTYHKQYADGAIYGFDTAHFYDYDDSYSQQESYLITEVESLADQMLEAYRIREAIDQHMRKGIRNGL